MRFSLYGMPIDHLTDAELHKTLQNWILGDQQKVIVTPNPEFVMQAIKEPWFLKAVQRADLALPDAAGLRFALAAENAGQLKYRHTGVDTLEKLAKMCEMNGKRLLILGGVGGRARKAAAYLKSKYPQADIVGHNPGTLLVKSGVMELDVTTRDYLDAKKPDVLALALTQTKQMQFMRLLQDFPSIKICIGVGGAVDMFSGALPRAPKWMRRAGLEWLWRLFIEPRRARRIANAAVIFPIIVAMRAIKQRRFMQSCKRVFPEVLMQLRGK